MDKYQVLKTYFGHTEFRNGQEQIIDSLLRGQDVLGVMPTGAGKSVCYQIPALLSGGITLVISPLISLMKDQVHTLQQAGVSVAYLNSSLSMAQYRSTLQQAAQGAYKILYVAPERLVTEEFLHLCRNIEISIVAVDEAHCVSQWGQDFRPSYLKIIEFIEQLSCRPAIGAFTATATAEVKEDIAAILRLQDPFTITTGFDRKNLYFAVRHSEHKNAELLDIVKKNAGKCGVVYCATRKTVEEVCRLLCDFGIRATRYHAGLEDGERRQNQEDFIFDRCDVMVATNAFGMGIDKSNVSYVVHYNMPKNIESYYQEAGRAGRDGEPADCILLYSGADVRMNLFLIDKSDSNLELDAMMQEEVKARDRERLRSMTFYCNTNDCLRTYLLQYFGERSAPYCGNCSNCETGFETVDVTVDSQKILSCIARTNQRFGLKMIVDILRGSKGERLLKLGLDRQSTYGLLQGSSEKRVRSILNHLLWEGYIQSTNTEYPVLMLTERSRLVLKGQEPVFMKLAKIEPPKSSAASHKVGGREEVVDVELLNCLKRLRYTLASEAHIPAYIIFTDAALRDMCVKQPVTLDAFLAVSGVGKAKQEKYGRLFVEEIQRYLEEDSGKDYE